MPALTTIQLRRGTSSEWAASTNALAQGEFGYDTVLKKYKIGDGTSLWSSLPWATVLPGELLAGTGITISSGPNGYTISGSATTSSLSQILDVTATANEVNRLAGVTPGTVKSSGVVVVDNNNNISGFNNLSSSGVLSGGTLSISGSGTIGSDLIVAGNLTVNGTTTTLNSTTVTVDDKNIELASIANPTDITADGAGITVKGSTDKTFNWVASTNSWTSSENLNLSSGKVLKINGTEVLSATNFTGKAATAGNADTVTTNANLTGDVTSVGNSTSIASGVVNNSHISPTAAISYSKLNLGGSIVNGDISGSANISDTKLATISSTGKVANSATTATSNNTNSAIVARDSSGNFSANVISASLSGNASTATTLQTARTINGATFDGSANITIVNIDGGTP